MIRRRVVSKRIDALGKYQKTTLEGVIIFIDPTDGWCNVELANGDVLYRIYFGEGVNPRLKRLEQAVTLIQTIGTKYNYIISGAARRVINSAEFADKGITQWDDTPTKAKWNAHWQWK